MIPVKLCNLPPFHAVAGRLISLSAEADADLKSVLSIVGSDPALAAEILFLSNSSLYGFPARIESLRHAVALLGFDSVKRLAMTIMMRHLAQGVGPFVRSCWCHSVACAVIAERIAPLFGCDTEQAYTAGLMHDIGRLGFLRTYPSQISSVLAREYNNAEELIAAEREVMNASHGEAGAWLIEYWALPHAFAHICAHHHDRPQENESPTLRVIKTACRLADATGYSAVRYTMTPDYASVLSDAAPHIAADLFLREDALRARVESRLKIFDFLVASVSRRDNEVGR